MSAVCALCERLIVRDKSTPWYRWECIQRPMEAEYNPVTGETVADPPYALCRYVNKDGACEDFVEGPNTLHPKEAT